MHIHIDLKSKVKVKVQIGIFECTGIMGQDLVHPYIILENEKFFELKSGGYRDGIKRKETR